MDPDDSWQQHAADPLKRSYLLADPRTVQIVTEGAARGIKDLERYEMDVARDVWVVLVAFPTRTLRGTHSRGTQRFE